jgi:Fe-S-cluster containining protein
MTVRLPVVSSTAKSPRKARAFWGAKYLSFRCTHCGACCKETIAPITGDDLERLVKGTGLSPHQVVDFYAGSEFEDGGEGLVYVDLDVGSRTMGLRRAVNRRGQPTGCRFFVEERCSVYDHRPVTCRLWPFTVALDDQGQMNRLSINDAVDCAYQLDGVVDGKALTRHWREDDVQDGRWQRVVERWNRRHAGGTRESFFAFLGY